MKKKSCRRTEDENKLHEKAVKMRKMTDEQLVHYVEDRVEKARSEGYNEGYRKGQEKASAPRVDIEAVMEAVGRVKGIGTGKANMIKVALETKFGSK